MSKPEPTAEQIEAAREWCRDHGDVIYQEAVPALAALLAEREAGLRTEQSMDYADMRKFQMRFIEADQKRRALCAQVEELERERAAWLEKACRAVCDICSEEARGDYTEAVRGEDEEWVHYDDDGDPEGCLAADLRNTFPAEQDAGG